MNGDAAEALARAKGRAAQSAAKPTSEPVARLVPEAARPPQRNRDLVIEHAPEEPTSPRLDVKGTPADIETFDGTLDFNAVAHSAAKADGIEVQEEVVLKPQDLVVEGLAHTQFESGIFAMSPEASESEDEPKIDLPLIMPDDGFDDATPPPPSLPALPAPPPAAVALAGDDGAAAPAPPSRAGPGLPGAVAAGGLRQGPPGEGRRPCEARPGRRPPGRRPPGGGRAPGAVAGSIGHGWVLIRPVLQPDRTTGGRRRGRTCDARAAGAKLGREAPAAGGGRGGPRSVPGLAQGPQVLVHIAVLNGPNLNLLGEREPELYGRITLVEIEARTREQARALGVQVSWTQTNHEGELVDAIQRLKGKADGLMINAAAFKIGRASCRERV